MITLEQKQKLKDDFTLAHHSYEKGLNTRAFFKLHNRLTSEDLVQNTFLKTWSYIVKGGKIVMMKAFLYNVLNHLIIDEYRKHKTISLDVLLEKGFDQSNHESHRLPDKLDGGQAFLLINKLPKKYRTIMKMKYIKSLPVKEISLYTGQSRNTIAVQAHRGLAKLKLLYKAKP